MKRKIFARFLKVAAVLVCVHFGSRGFIAAQDAVFGQVAQATENVVAYSAFALGYEPKREPERELGPRTLCTMEAVRRGISPAFACSLLDVESASDQYAVSPKGAIGYMQIMPSNIRLLSECGVSRKQDLFDARKNVCSGVLLFDRFLRDNGDNPVLALEAYNGGQSCRGRCAESINHARKVLKRAVRDVS